MASLPGTRTMAFTPRGLPLTLITNRRGALGRPAVRSRRASVLLFRRHLWQLGERGLEHRLVVILIDERASEIVGIGLHVEVAVAAKIEENGRRPALFPRLDRFVDRTLDGVIGLGRRHD